MLVDTLRRTMPLVASVALLVTLTVCLALTLVLGRYVGGLKLPYFSDMGRGTSMVHIASTHIVYSSTLSEALTSLCMDVCK